MFSNYLKVAFRTTLRHKGYSFINIVGLAIGMASCILIMLWVLQELSYDRFHTQADNLFRVTEYWQDGDNVGASALTAVPMGPALKEELPEVARSTRFHIDGKQIIKYGNVSFQDEVIALADPDFLQMFTFPLLQGDPTTALSDKFSVIVTETMKRKIFGEQDAIGQTLSLDNRDFVVSGVMADLPSNCHLDFDCLVPFDSRPDWLKQITDNWRVSTFYTYVQLRSGVDVDQINLKCDDLVARHATAGDLIATHVLQPVTRIHLYHDVDDYLEGHGDIKYVYLFSSLALLTLLIACMNFMNLSTARSVARAREVGVRKVVGARRADVIRQFLGESSLAALLALVLALVLVEVLLPVINNWSGKQLSLMSSTNAILLIYMAGLVFVSGVIAGYYPAFVLSSFKPAETVKGTGGARGSGRWFRRVLVILQFGMAGVLILAALIIYKQMDFVRNRSLGFDKEHMVYFVSRGEYTTNYETIRESLLAHPAIAGVTAGRPPVRSPGSASDIWWDGQGARQVGRWSSLAVRRNYLETFDMNIVMGQDLTKESSGEVSREFVVNQAACRAMGIESPLGKHFKFSRHNFDGNALEKTSYEGTIVGVVQDFHFGPLYNAITPVIMFVDETQARQVCVRINASMTAEAMTLLKDYWQRYAPDRIFEYHFLDESLDSFYHAEVQLSRILYSYTVLAVFLSCLGLFGLSSYMVQQRTTEIGVRKVLGSSVAGVVHLLTKELVLLVAVANVFAWPVAWYVMGRWLEKFVYRIEIGIGTFFLAGFAAVLITLVTVSFQAVRAARTNPVEALRYE